MRARPFAAVALLATLLAAQSASAYCRTTTCDPTLDDCEEDAAGCFTRGFDVFWSSSCITISVQADGAPNAGIDFDTARHSVERAFSAWTGVKCLGGESPSIRVVVDGPVACGESEYNQKKRNANIVVFRDDTWPYAKASPDMLGFTRPRFDADTGELYDVDIEINAVTEPLSAGVEPAENEVDLDSVLTHEVGHLLGLNHTLDVSATMAASYTIGSTELRTPAKDDIDGICAVYPPGRSTTTSSCEPRHGFSELCAADQSDPLTDAIVEPNPPKSGGCSLAAARATTSASGNLWLLTLALVGCARRRRSLT